MNIKKVAINVLSVSALFYVTNLHPAATAPSGLNQNIGVMINTEYYQRIVPTIVFSDDGTCVFATIARNEKFDITIRSWLLQNTNPLRQTMLIQNASILQERFPGHKSIIQNVAISPDGNHVAAIFDGGMHVAIWNTLLKTLWFYGSNLVVNAATFTPDSKQILVQHQSLRSKSKRGYKTNITFIKSDLENPEYAKSVDRLEATIGSFDYPFYCVSTQTINRDGLIACANPTQISSNSPSLDEIRIYNPITKEWICIIGTNQTITSIAITADGKRIITAGYRQQPNKTPAESEKVISFWDVESKTCIHEFNVGSLPCHVAIGPDDTQIAVCLENGIIIAYTDKLAKENKSIEPWTVVFQS
ncbi:MAG: hypothetical protein US49_C0010G0014 [candidate division TM6 bacterium GW2011_GWF2_37_49]|nr:MAG: hypothetical protein US49_C0010G0014 [candidate division TM6 bacterium GW2011_GWF2_37_49]